jgi:hypothetical protein
LKNNLLGCSRRPPTSTTTSTSTTSTAVSGFSSEDQNICREDRLHLQLGFSCGLVALLRLQLLLLRRRLRETVVDLCLVLLYDTRISLGLHCSSTSTAAYLKFITAPCSSARGLFQFPAWLCASALREAPGPPGGCAGFYRPVPFPHPPPPEQFLQTQLWLRKRPRLTHCLLNA